MKDTRISMGMPITVAVADRTARTEDIEAVFAYFDGVDRRFSTYKADSEIMRINRSEIREQDYSEEMREVFALAQKTKQESGGYFDIKKPDGSLDPSGIVKGWAIKNAAALLLKKGYKNFYIDAGGDIQSYGRNEEGSEWSVGVRNPFNREEVIKIIYPKGSGVATSGTYVRGQHIYNPHAPTKALGDVVSLTVLGSNVLEADRFATAAFAMGAQGIQFVERQPGLEGYAVDTNGMAVSTSGFEKYLYI